MNAWEACWAPYDEPTYADALRLVRPDDVVLDIGAGDLRFARQVAAIARRVYAIEVQPAVLAGHPALPSNLIAICADARCIRWPAGITLGVLLMRHCTHVGPYVQRLRQAGCRALITNARWGMGVELMDLGPRQPWELVTSGWYACTCGQTGFVPTSPELFSGEQLWHVAEVESCPACSILNKLPVSTAGTASI